MYEFNEKDMCKKLLFLLLVIKVNLIMQLITWYQCSTPLPYVLL